MLARVAVEVGALPGVGCERCGGGWAPAVVEEVEVVVTTCMKSENRYFPHYHRASWATFGSTDS